jgi:hypothetical protein
MDEAPALVIPEDPFQGATIPAPRTLLPTVLAEAAAEAPLMQSLSEQAPADPLDRWYETFKALLDGLAVGDAVIRPESRQQVFEALLVAYHPGEVAVPEREAFELLQRLGAVTLAGEAASLTPLGVWGLFKFCGWTDETPWILEVDEWRADLTSADLEAWLQAMTEQRLRQRSSWLESADPAMFARQLVDLMLMVGGVVRTAAFAFLLRLGPPAVPAVLELAQTELIGWSWMWAQNNDLQLPRELTKAEHAEATWQFMPALAELQAHFLESGRRPQSEGATALDGDDEQAMLLRRQYGIGEPLSDAERKRLAQLLADQAFSRRTRPAGDGR